MSGRSVSVRGNGRTSEKEEISLNKQRANGRESSVELPMNNPNLKLLHAINEYSVEASYAWHRMSIICQCFWLGVCNKVLLLRLMVH